MAAGRSVNSDFTAIAVTEVWQRVRVGAPLPPAPYHVDELERESVYIVQSVERLPHGLSWRETGAAIVAILAGLYDEEAARRAAGVYIGEPPAMLPRTLYADRTGLGDPMVELLTTALSDEPRTRDVEVVALSFVAGEKFDRVRGVVGKLRLVSRLQALLATKPPCVELPKLHPQIPVLLRELDAYRLKLREDTGRETIGGIGEHDDMVTALALSTVDDPAYYQLGSIRFDAEGWQ